MELTLWTYEGPPHVGAMRIASSMNDIHYVLHAPQGDTYADLLFTMIERRGQRPPVTYTTFQARDLGGDTAELVKKNIKEAVERFKPKTLLVGESCTAELIQDQPGALAKGMGFDMPIVNLELPAYSKKENWGASETFYQLIRTLLKEKVSSSERISPLRWKELGRRPKVNILGPSLLGFRCRDDVIEIVKTESFNLIETLSKKITQEIYKKYNSESSIKIFEIFVTVHKPDTILKEKTNNLSVTYSEKFK